jgi:uncharacterized membrane protein (Fun14 family)
VSRWQNLPGWGGPQPDTPRVPPPWTAKSVLAVAALMALGGWHWLTGDAQRGALSFLTPYLPGLMTAGASYIGGYCIGWGARRTVKVTAFVAAIALTLIGLLAHLGVDGAAAEHWVSASAGWVGEQVEGAEKYLLTLLPSAAAAGTGVFLGFRRK